MMERVHAHWLILCAVLNYALLSHSLPVSENDTVTENVNSSLPQDLLVIKTVVYEVGILTDADNETSDNSTEISHQVDLTFYDPHLNGSQIDLSNVPLPVQTNISGHEVTGFVPANLGSFVVPPPGNTTIENASDLPLNLPIFPNAVVSVTHNISTTDPEKASLLVSGLPEIVGLKDPFTTPSVVGADNRTHH